MGICQNLKEEGIQGIIENGNALENHTDPKSNEISDLSFILCRDLSLAGNKEKKIHLSFIQLLQSLAK